MSRHTPGPWLAMSNDGYTFYIHAKSAQETEPPVARVLADQREGINPEDNARLLAAAPDLLSACQNLLMELEAHEIHAPARIAHARAAIEKAGGSEE